MRRADDTFSRAAVREESLSNWDAPNWIIEGNRAARSAVARASGRAGGNVPTIAPRYRPNSLQPSGYLPPLDL